MWETCYFLDVGNLTENKQAILREMEALLDKERLLKYQNAKAENVRLLSLGAGALIRLAVMEYAAGRDRDGGGGDAAGSDVPALRRLTPKALLKAAGGLSGHGDLEIRYRTGPNGKPYFEELPLHFSLSHSGSMVMLAISEREIGADVQEITGKDWKKLSERFFSEEEKTYLRRLEENSPKRAEDEFHRLWCLKEAYGKWTGEGVGPYLDIPILKQMKRENLREGRMSRNGKTYRHALYRE